MFRLQSPEKKPARRITAFHHVVRGLDYFMLEKHFDRFGVGHLFDGHEVFGWLGGGRCGGCRFPSTNPVEFFEELEIIRLDDGLNTARARFDGMVHDGRGLTNLGNVHQFLFEPRFETP